MLSVPLPFIAGLAFALTLFRNLRGVETGGSRFYLFVFLAAYAVQGMIVGLRFGYGIEALGPVQPITAAAMPPLAFLAFRALSASPIHHSWLHLGAPIAVACGITFVWPLVDILLVSIFLFYAVLLYRLTLNEPEAVAEASLDRTIPALRAARLTAGLMAFFGLADGLVSIFVALYGPAYVPLAVSAMNIAAIVVVLVYYFAPEPRSGGGSAMTVAVVQPTVADKALLSRVEAALDANDLYRQDDLSLAKLARRAGLPAREVSIAINRITGLNVSQFVNNRRIREACRLLEETEKPLTEIMFDCGFSTKSNFNREFRRVTDASPSQWRALRRAA
ncbi:AraC family transcriptional regulator [Rhizobium sp. FY34]|uniref:helix-turn-helix domain-containing protein n=1 Tax=Rhizobium sp. FY34 TaxID=2562309 RepID=UPI0010C0D45A|nr:AraC family transcriptional regulator [Rhizobium sp. FY34]